MKPQNLLYGLFLPFSMLSASVAIADEPTDLSKADRGRYLVSIGGCNDCHTPGYPEAAGKIPASQWLTGSIVGFQGPWGTSYPVNLRLYVQQVTSAQWVARATVDAPADAVVQFARHDRCRFDRDVRVHPRARTRGRTCTRSRGAGKESGNTVLGVRA